MESESLGLIHVDEVLEALGVGEIIETYPEADTKDESRITWTKQRRRPASKKQEEPI